MRNIAKRSPPLCCRLPPVPTYLTRSEPVSLHAPPGAADWGARPPSRPFQSCALEVQARVRCSMLKEKDKHIFIDSETGESCNFSV